MYLRILSGLSNFHKGISFELIKKYDQLNSEGQNPDTLIIACSDSRVMPEMLTFASPGDLFYHRNVGNLIPAYTPKLLKNDPKNIPSEYATIEFAVKGLKVKNIVVCGHSDCGAMKNKRNPSKELPAVTNWVSNQETPLGTVELEIDPKDSALTTVTKANILVQLDHLKTFPEIQRQLSVSGIRLHAWYFDMHTKQVFIYNPSDKMFVSSERALEYEIDVRSKEIATKVALEYLRSLQTPTNKLEHAKRLNLFNELQNSLSPIWEHIKYDLIIELWEEFKSIYKYTNNNKFKTIVENLEHFSLTESDTRELKQGFNFSLSIQALIDSKTPRVQLPEKMLKDRPEDSGRSANSRAP